MKNRWIGGLLGLIFGGGVGGVVGYLIGWGTEFVGDNKGNDEKKRTRTRTEYANPRRDFFISFMVLVAAVMKADGKVMKSELEVVKTFLRNNFKENDALTALKLLKDLLDNDYDTHAVASQIKRHLSYSARLELLHLLWSIAVADNEISRSEIKLISEIAEAIGIQTADAKSIEAMFARSDYHRFQASSRHTSHSTALDYEILQISESASDEEVKKAYRRMAMKYHPDKVAGVGEEAQRAATEKFREVNEAYQRIKQKRGIS